MGSEVHDFAARFFVLSGRLCRGWQTGMNGRYSPTYKDGAQFLASYTLQHINKSQLGFRLDSAHSGKRLA